MPKHACLHIQARDADPVRVVSLPGGSVRIGRASHCEVRLPEPEVAEEECLLKRFGRTWHIVPVGRPGIVSIDDHLVEESQPLPYGVPFRVGDHRLTLQSSVDNAPGRGSFERPITLEAPAGTSRPAAATPDEPNVPPAKTPGSPAGVPAEERLARWKARQERREAWSQSQLQERRWEE